MLLILLKSSEIFVFPTDLFLLYNEYLYTLALGDFNKLFLIIL